MTNFKKMGFIYIVLIGFSIGQAALNKTIDVALLDIEKIEITRGATEISHGANTPANTDICAAIRGIDYVELNAKINPNIPEGDIPASTVIWSGGEEVPGHPLQRKVSKGHWNKNIVTVELTGRANTKKTLFVYIVGAIAMGVKQDGSTYPDNDKSAGFVADLGNTGINGPDPNTGTYNSHIEIEFSVQPDELINDANAGIFNKDDIQWDVSRDKRVKYWKKRNGIWSLYDDRGNAWASDDNLGHDDEDNNPWDGNSHLYGNDGPGMPNGVPAGAWFVNKLNMREFVKVGLGGTTGPNGDICSDYQYWHAFRSLRDGGSINTGPNGICNTVAKDDDLQLIELNKGDATKPNQLAISKGPNITLDTEPAIDDIAEHVWKNDVTYDSELESGNTLWGNTPPTP